MNTADLAEQIASDHGLTKTKGREIIDAMLEAIVNAASTGEEVAFNGFGRFKVTERAAREGRNPATGETIQIAASRKLGFSPAKPVRDRLNAGSKTGAKAGAKGGAKKAAAPAAKGAAAKKK